MEQELRDLIVREVAARNRPDLFREPLVAFSSAHDPRYAELKTIVDEAYLCPPELMADAQSVISYMILFTEEVVKAPQSDDPTLWGDAYHTANALFGPINEAIIQHLTDRGFSAMRIPAAYAWDPTTLSATWSDISAGAIAGLGTFGANNMLITEKGSGGRLGTVLTSAPLQMTTKATQNKCPYPEDGSCGLCFQICPSKALRLDKMIARADCEYEAGKDNKAYVCGKCISVCPLGYIEA